MRTRRREIVVFMMVQKMQLGAGWVAGGVIGNSMPSSNARLGTNVRGWYATITGIMYSLNLREAFKRKNRIYIGLLPIGGTPSPL